MSHRSLIVQDVEFFKIVDHHIIEAVFDFSIRTSYSPETATKMVLGALRQALQSTDRILSLSHQERRIFLLRLVVRGAREHRLTSLFTFQSLDDLIRSEPTLVTPTTHLTRRERHHLLWELKQSCLTAALDCLSPGERMASILGTIMGLSPQQAAEVLEISESAFKVRFSRALKKVSTYLSPRCAHINPSNPCRCSSRLGVALQNGFIQEIREAQLRRQGAAHREFEEEETHRDAVSLYESLPLWRPRRDRTQELVKALEGDAAPHTR